MSSTPSVVQWQDHSLLDFKRNIAQILKDFAPSEVPAFNLFGDDLIRELSNKPLDLGGPTKRPTFEFGGAVEFGLLTLHLLAGTLALIDVLHRSKSIASEHALKAKIDEEWVTFLVASGMNRDLAKDIPPKHALDLAVFLAKNKIVSTDD